MIGTRERERSNKKKSSHKLSMGKEKLRNKMSGSCFIWANACSTNLRAPVLKMEWKIGKEIFRKKINKNEENRQTSQINININDKWIEAYHTNLLSIIIKIHIEHRNAENKSIKDIELSQFRREEIIIRHQASQSCPAKS